VPSEVDLGAKRVKYVVSALLVRSCKAQPQDRPGIWAVCQRSHRHSPAATARVHLGEQPGSDYSRDPRNVRRRPGLSAAAGVG
jgi:hypothetical protein